MCVKWYIFCFGPRFKNSPATSSWFCLKTELNKWLDWRWPKSLRVVGLQEIIKIKKLIVLHLKRKQALHYHPLDSWKWPSKPVWWKHLKCWGQPALGSVTPWLTHRDRASSLSPPGRSCERGTPEPGPGSAPWGTRVGSWWARSGCCGCGCTRPSPDSEPTPEGRRGDFSVRDYTKHKALHK